MDRIIVQVARIRALDAELGDVVARDPDSSGGWFQLHQIDQLHDGKINLSDGGVHNSFAVFPLEIVGLQIAKTVEIGEQPVLPNFRADSIDDADDDTEEEAADDDSHLEPVSR